MSSFTCVLSVYETEFSSSEWTPVLTMTTNRGRSEDRIHLRSLFKPLAFLIPLTGCVLN